MRQGTLGTLPCKHVGGKECGREKTEIGSPEIALPGSYQGGCSRGKVEEVGGGPKFSHPTIYNFRTSRSPRDRLQAPGWCSSLPLAGWCEGERVWYPHLSHPLFCSQADTAGAPPSLPALLPQPARRDACCLPRQVILPLRACMCVCVCVHMCMGSL